jgi:hypothetical protein
MTVVTVVIIVVANPVLWNEPAVIMMGWNISAVSVSDRSY